MRKLGIVITVLLLVAVLGLMLASVGVISLPLPKHTPMQRTSVLPFTSKLQETSGYTAEIRPRLVVDTPVGSIEVRSAEVEQLEITMVAEAGAGSAERAQQLLAGISLDVTTTKNATKLVVQLPKVEAQEEAKADLIILVPGTIDLELRSGLGDIQVNQVQGNVQVHTHLGTITVQDCQGSAHLETALGDIRVTGSSFTDRLTAITHLGDLQISATLAASNVLETRLGDLRLHLLPDEAYVLDGKLDLGGIYLAVPFTGEQSEKSVKGIVGRGEQRGSISARLALGSLRITN
ncbi:MAG TPA: DUF4097 family beta strand repeat-containing protein [Limnochordia bacterium]|nr:DUF4097 family beta strand repeat-containing protein [Limnochordia bacterium]